MRQSASSIEFECQANDGETFVSRLAEKGALRLRRAKVDGRHATVVNTAGGIVECDRLALTVSLRAGAALTLTTAAAEKVYRSSGGVSNVDVCLNVAAGSRLLYAPHETIFFDHARLRRRFDIYCEAGAAVLAVEMLQFGRIAYGEASVTGVLRDSWRLRIMDRLVYAEEVSLDGEIGAILDRRGVAGGCRAVATILLSDGDVARHLDPLRTGLDEMRERMPAAMVEGAAGMREGVIVVRLLAASSEHLRSAVAVVVGAIDGFALPPCWS